MKKVTVTCHDCKVTLDLTISKRELYDSVSAVERLCYRRIEKPTDDLLFGENLSRLWLSPNLRFSTTSMR
jgi:hypothetical protein